MAIALLLLPAAASARQPVLAGTQAVSIAALRAKAESGDAQARYDLGVALLCGTRVPRDPVEAAHWIRLAADQQHVAAQGLHGWLYLSGTGLDQDNAQAATWLRLSAEANNTAAQNKLGVLYALGQGVAYDRAEAQRWFRAAASKGAADAVRNLEVLDSGAHGRPGETRGNTAQRLGTAQLAPVCRP